jgi:hypothetical protein
MAIWLKSRAESVFASPHRLTTDTRAAIEPARGIGAP